MTESAPGIYPKFRWFEDFALGQNFVFGAWEMTREDMLGFARVFDPEPFHLDDAAAAALGWGGLIASGLHVVSIFRRLTKDAFPNAETVISPGWDGVRWPNPTRIGDVLRCHSEIVEHRLLSSRPGEGLIKMHCQLKQQDDRLLADLTVNWFVRQRAAV